jgi:hypothetical protein
MFENLIRISKERSKNKGIKNLGLKIKKEV